MSRMLQGLAVAAVVLAIGASARAEGEDGLIISKELSMDLAKGIAEAALAECRSKGFHTAAVVVDKGGHVLVSLRDEQATPQTGELARRKAYTARMYRSTTMEWIARMQKDPSLQPQRDLADVIALGGGVPIKVGDEVIGGIGSAGSSQPQDDACAKAGVAKFPALNFAPRS
jgi:uncharacterized protein GlcG (DUF336 family)